MIRVIAITVVMLALLDNSAYAEQKNTKTAQKAVQLIRKAGMESPLLEDTLYFIDDRYDDSRFDIARGEYEGVNLRLQHRINSPDYKNLEIKIAPENKKYHFTVNHDTVMVRFSTSIEW